MLPRGSLGFVSFEPGIKSAREAGVRVSRGPYADGLAGHKQSLEMMGEKIREGRLDPAIIGWARTALQKAGLDGRNHPSVRDQVTALLNEIRATVIYTPDPTGAEVIQSPAATLCLRPGLCLRGGDCDDQVVLLCSLCCAVGLDAIVVKEDYENHQSHVYVAVRDENGKWFFADPSTNKPIFDSPSMQATSSEYVDPIAGAPVEIVGIGNASRAARGLAAPPGNWVATQPSGAVTAGLRYAVGIVAPSDWTQGVAQSYFSGQSYSLGGLAVDAVDSANIHFMVETVQPGNVSGQFTSWIMIGIARQSGTIVGDSTVSIAGVLQEAPPAAATAPATTALALPPGPSTPANAISVGNAALVAVGVGAAIGVFVALSKRGR